MQDPKKSGGIAKYVLTLLVAVIASVQAATFGMADFRVYQDMKSDIAEVGRRMPIQRDSAGVDPGSVHYAGLGRIVIDGEVMQESASNSVQEIAQPVVSQTQIPLAAQRPAQTQQPETPEAKEEPPSKEAPKQDAPSSTQAVSKPASPAPSQSGGGAGSSSGGKTQAGSSNSGGQASEVKAETAGGSNRQEPPKSSNADSGANDDITVYVSNRSNTIHSIPDCSNMKNYREMTKSEADANGYDYCKNCW